MPTELKGERWTLERLQKLDEPTKRRVLIGVTVAVMLIVIYVWLGYFNNLVAGLSQAPVAQNQTSSAPVAAVPAAGKGQASAWQNMENGMANMYNAFTGSKQYDIAPKQ